MKIYSVTRARSDEHILDGLMGKDAWIHVFVSQFPTRPDRMIRIVRKDATDARYGPRYLVNDFPVATLHRKDNVRYCTLWEKDDCTTSHAWLWLRDMKIVRPVDIRSTDDLFVVEGNE